jgi:hypothetical protein
MLQSIRNQAYAPAAGARYPRGRFGDNLRQIAQLIKAEVGVEMAFADIGALPTCEAIEGLWFPSITIKSEP